MPKHYDNGPISKGKKAIELASDVVGAVSPMPRASLAASSRRPGPAGRSAASSPTKKSAAGKRVAQKRAAAKRERASVDRVDAGRRRTQVALKRTAAKRAATKKRAMATEKKRDQATARNRRYKDDRASRD